MEALPSIVGGAIGYASSRTAAGALLGALLGVLMAILWFRHALETHAWGSMFELQHDVPLLISYCAVAFLAYWYIGTIVTSVTGSALLCLISSIFLIFGTGGKISISAAS